MFSLLLGRASGRKIASFPGLRGQQCRVLFLLQVVRQLDVLLIGDHIGSCFLVIIFRKEFGFLRLPPPYHILHGIEAQQLLREHRKLERPLEYRCKLPQI